MFPFVSKKDEKPDKHKARKIAKALGANRIVYPDGTVEVATQTDLDGEQVDDGRVEADR